jgi:hypothetical protein
MRFKAKMLRPRMLARLMVVGLLATGVLVSPATAQTFTAQIQTFWNQLRTGRLVFTNLRAVNATVTGTCTGCGGNPGGAVNAIQYNNAGVFGGFGTYDGSGGVAIPAGTITANHPINITQTWNNAAVAFQGLLLDMTQTAADGASTLIDVRRSGVSQFRCSTNDGGCRVAGDLITTVNVSFGDTGFIQSVGRAYFHTPSTRDFAIGSNGSAGVEYTIKVGSAPALTSGWGVGASVSGTNSVGRVTIGAGPGAAGVLTFSAAWTTNAPHCDAIDETTGVVIPAVATTAAVTIAGVFTAADKVSYHCVGWQ